MAKNVEVVSRPKMIKWIEIPAIIGDDDHVEFLKRDLLLKGLSGKMDELTKAEASNDDETAFFYNLDKIFLINNVMFNDRLMFSRDLIKVIKEKSPYKSLVHTNIIDYKLANVFRTEGIPFIEKNLEDRSNAYITATNLIQPFFSINNQVVRSYIRVNLSMMDYKVEINKHSSYEIKVDCKLKDLSLNGMGFSLSDENLCNFFSLKDLIIIKVHVSNFIIKVNKAIITRIDCNKREIGVNFNINDNNMVSLIDSEKLSKMILKWIKEVYQN